MGAQAFVPEQTVKAFDVGVLGGLLRPDEHERDPVPTGPDVERSGNELRPVIDDDALWQAAVHRQGVHPWTGQGTYHEAVDSLSRQDAPGLRVNHLNHRREQLLHGDLP